MKLRQHSTRFAIAMILAAAWPSVAMAQTAQITGRITDATSAVVVGTEISATNVETGVKWNAKSNEVGYYVIPLLPPGQYKLQVEMTGFKPVSRSGITLEVGQVARVNFTLQPGDVTEQVEVVAEVPRVQTEESSLGTVVERKRIEDLPLNGRHVFALIQVVAGVQPTNKAANGFADIDNGNISDLRFNGGTSRGSQINLDGNVNVNPIITEISVVPMLDAVEEFKVETNALKAEYGQTSGGYVNVVTKSGTNEPHGSLYEFVRNDKLDARNAFATQRDPITGRIKEVLRYNQFGGTLGGPVYIPRTYDGRNRTFFFFGYEQWHWRSSLLRRGTVPTAAERSGDFSNTRDGKGNVIPLFDPGTTVPNPNGSGFVRLPLGSNVVPKNRMDPVSLNVLDFMPLPNVEPNNPFTNAQNFLSLASFPDDQGVTNIRIDQRFSERDSLFFRYTGTRNTRQGKGYGLGPADPDTFARRDQRDNHNGLVRETHTFSPTMINELAFGATRQNLDFQHPSFGGDWPDKLGMAPVIPRELFPGISISGMLTLGASAFATGKRAQHTVQLVDSVTLIKGRHQMKFGTDHRWVRMNWVLQRFRSGTYSFSGSLTGNPQKPAGTGFGMATFLLGEVSGGQMDNLPFFSHQAWTNGSYFQDDIKITPKLTLNLGIRYDIDSGPIERYDRYSNFNPFVVNPETGMPGVLEYAGVSRPRHVVQRDTNNFGPRFGFAYAATGDGRTVLRGGYGLVYVYTEGADAAQGGNSLGFSVTTPFTSPGLGPFTAFQFGEGPDPASILVPLGAQGGPSAFRGQSVRYQDPNAPTGYLQQWNLTLQRQIVGGWVLSAAYAGNHAVKQFGADYNLNQLDPTFFSEKLALRDQVPNPFYGQIKTGALSAKTVTRSQLLQPFPDYLGIVTFSNHGASSTYHSLQFTAERKYARGLSALISYTNSKLINDSISRGPFGSGGVTGEYRVGRLDRRIDRSLDELDVSQRLVASAVYELPFLKNRRGAVAYLLGGWQINSITTLQTGFPLKVRGADNFTGINWPDVIRDPSLPNSERSVLRWFDTDAFRNPPDWVIGNIPRTLPNTRGPGLAEVNLSAFKNFAIKEGMRLEFRFDAFNALNRVNLNDPSTSFQPGPDGLNRNPNFGRIMSSLSPRTLQLGLRLAF